MVRSEGTPSSLNTHAWHRPSAGQATYKENKFTGYIYQMSTSFLSSGADYLSYK